MQDVKGLWRSVLGELEISVTRGHYLTWLKPTYIVSNEAGRVVVGVPNIFNKQWLENKYHSQIKEALAKLDGQIHTGEDPGGGKAGGAARAPHRPRRQHEAGRACSGAQSRANEPAGRSCAQDQ